MQTENKKTFREISNALNPQDDVEKANVLKKCLQENTEDKPSTQDIFDAVEKMRIMKNCHAQVFLNMTSSLVETYLTEKEFTKEQPSIQNFFENPFGAAHSLFRDVEGSISGLSEKSKFVNEFIKKTLQPQGRFDVDQINNFKKDILRVYFENNNVTYNEFKNLLKLNQIDDPQIQTDLLVSFLKRSNLVEPKFVENVNDFLRDNNKLTASHKVKILQEYLMGKNQEITPGDHNKVLNLAKNIGLELSTDTGRTSSDLHNLRLEVVVENINKDIKIRKPRTGVAATSLTPGVEASIGRVERTQ